MSKTVVIKCPCGAVIKTVSMADNSKGEQSRHQTKCRSCKKDVIYEIHNFKCTSWNK